MFHVFSRSLKGQVEMCMWHSKALELNWRTAGTPEFPGDLRNGWRLAIWKLSSYPGTQAMIVTELVFRLHFSQKETFGWATDLGGKRYGHRSRVYLGLYLISAVTIK